MRWKKPVLCPLTLLTLSTKFYIVKKRERDFNPIHPKNCLPALISAQNVIKMNPKMKDFGVPSSP